MSTSFSFPVSLLPSTLTVLLALCSKSFGRPDPTSPFLRTFFSSYSSLLDLTNSIQTPVTRSPPRARARERFSVKRKEPSPHLPSPSSCERHFPRGESALSHWLLRSPAHLLRRRLHQTTQHIYPAQPHTLQNTFLVSPASLFSYPLHRSPPFLSQPYLPQPPPLVRPLHPYNLRLKLTSLLPLQKPHHVRHLFPRVPPGHRLGSKRQIANTTFLQGLQRRRSRSDSGIRPRSQRVRHERENCSTRAVHRQVPSGWRRARLELLAGAG